VSKPGVVYRMLGTECRCFRSVTTLQRSLLPCIATLTAGVKSFEEVLRCRMTSPCQDCLRHNVENVWPQETVPTVLWKKSNTWDELAKSFWKRMRVDARCCQSLECFNLNKFPHDLKSCVDNCTILA